MVPTEAPAGRVARYQKTDSFILKTKPADDIHLPWEMLPTHSLYSYVRAQLWLQMTLEPMLSNSLQILGSMLDCSGWYQMPLFLG